MLKLMLILLVCKNRIVYFVLIISILLIVKILLKLYSSEDFQKNCFAILKLL